jgi:hypothetical protein
MEKSSYVNIEVYGETRGDEENRFKIEMNDIMMMHGYIF